MYFRNITNIKHRILYAETLDVVQNFLNTFEEIKITVVT